MRSTKCLKRKFDEYVSLKKWDRDLAFCDKTMIQFEIFFFLQFLVTK